VGRIGRFLMSIIPNSGTAGSALDATNNGLVRVEGPAAWAAETAAAGASNRLITSEGAGIGTATTLDMRLAITNHDVKWDIFARPWQVATSDAEISFSQQGTGWLVCRTPGQDVLCGDLAAVPFGVPVIFRVTWDNATTTARGLWKLTTAQTVDADIVDNAGWTQLGISTSVNEGSAGYSLEGSMALFAAGGAGWTLPGMSLLAATWSEAIDGAPGVSVYSSDLGAVDPAATTFVCSSGQTWDVERASSGPVTTLVPAGTVVYINPDSTVPTNFISTGPAADPSFKIDATRSALLMMTGQLGNDAVDTTDGIIKIGSDAASSAEGIGVIRTDSVTYGRIRASDGVTQTASGTASVDNDPTIPAVYAIYLNRDDGTLCNYRITADGTVKGNALSRTIPALDPLELRCLESVPGTVSAMMFTQYEPGEAPTLEQIKVIAAALLANANRPSTHTIGALPPAGHKVRGDTWTADNEQSTQFDGTKWQPLSPATGNIAALLANSDLLLGAS
jgi:hypothetical protein